MSTNTGDEHPARFAEVGGAFRDTWQRSRGSLSLLFVWACVALFVFTRMLGMLGIVVWRESIAFLGLSSAGVFQQHWWHQFLTAPLLHANVAHLLFNMLSLWFLGPAIERRIGRGSYVVFSVLCAISSMAGCLIFSRNSGTVTVGYSGVIFGILVAQARFFPDNIVAIFGFFPLKMRYAAWLLGAVEFYLTISPEGNTVAHAAHLFGAVAAAVYLSASARQSVEAKKHPHRPDPRQRMRRSRFDIPKEL